MSPRLHRESSADLVAAYIRQGILAGTLRTGDRLRQDEIADELGVSRIPVREAIIALDREGWLNIESNRSAYVTGLRQLDIQDHYELRGVVLGLVAVRASEAATPGDAKELERLYGAMKRAKEMAAFADANLGVLRFMLTLASSSRLRAALRVTPSILPDAHFDVVPGARKLQEAGIAAVIRSIKAEDADGADRAMRALLRRHGEEVVDAFAARGVLSTTAARVARKPGETSADAVARHVRRLVVDGKLQQGQRLPQDEIAAAVGVSRIPVREAIIALEREGWVHVVPHRGAFVNGLDDRAIVDHYELYGRYFAFAARRVIDHAAEEDRAGLDALADRVASATTGGPVDAAVRTYMGAIVTLAESRPLGVVLRSMVAVVPDNFVSAIPAARSVQKQGVAALHRAIRAGDADAADTACLSMERDQAAEVVAVRHKRPVVAV